MIPVLRGSENTNKPILLVCFVICVPESHLLLAFFISAWILGTLEATHFSWKSLVTEEKSLQGMVIP